MSSEPSPNERRLRLRAVLNAQFAVVLAVCLLAAAVGVGLVYTTHVEPGTETQTQEVELLVVESGYTHSAEVTEPNAVFDTGSILDDRDTYFTRIAPELDVNVETTYTAAAASDVEVETDSVLVIRNVGDDGVTYWSERETLASEQTSDVESGETVTSSFIINSTAIDEAATSIEDELGASPGETETYVETVVDVDGTFEGESRSYSRTLEMDVTHDGDTYTVSEPGIDSSTVDRTETVTVETTYGPLRSIGGPILFLLGIAGTAGLVYVRRETELALTPAEREYLSYRDDRSEFDEWITQFRLPPSVHDRETATAVTLRDLVDFAIDNDTGVVEDPETDAFHAVTTDLLYTYRPPSPSAPRSDDAAESETGAGADGTGGVELEAQAPTVEDVGGERSGEAGVPDESGAPDESGTPDEAWVDDEAADGDGNAAGDSATNGDQPN